MRAMSYVFMALAVMCFAVPAFAQKRLIARPARLRHRLHRQGNSNDRFNAAGIGNDHALKRTQPLVQGSFFVVEQLLVPVLIHLRVYSLRYRPLQCNGVG